MQDAIATCSAEIDAGEVRLAEHAGRDHLVAPVVAVQEMVLKDEFLPAGEIAASEPAWNGRVLPIGHPTDPEGNFVSANSPDTHDTRVVGSFFEADGSDGNLTGEIWVDVERSRGLASETGDDRFAKPLAVLASHATDGSDAANVADGLDVAVNADDVLEVSTAYFYRRDEAMGTHDGASYDATQHDVRPDHLALLPNSVGECSADDGCGAPRVHVHANVDADGQDAAGATPAGEQESLNNYATATMSNESDTIQWLASQTEFDADALEDFEGGHLETLRASVESAGESHEGCSCGANTEAQNDENEDGGEGGESDADTANAEEIEALRAEVEALKEEREAEAQARADDAAESIVTHATHFEDTDAVFEALGDDADRLETLADEFEAQAAESAAADFGGRVGANGAPGGSDDDASAYVDMATEANAARFGAPGEESE